MRLGEKILASAHIGNSQVPEVRNLFLSKLAVMRERGVECRLETLYPVVAVDMDIWDYVRCLGILTDNALEAALETEQPWVEIILLAQDGWVSFRISNPYANVIEPEKMWDNGWSTKGLGRGWTCPAISAFWRITPMPLPHQLGERRVRAGDDSGGQAMIGVYLCDDEEAVRRQIQAALERKIFMENYDMKMVCSAASAQELLAAAETERRGIYFLDVELRNGEWDGLDTTETRLRGGDFTKIVYTGLLVFCYWMWARQAWYGSYDTIQCMVIIFTIVFFTEQAYRIRRYSREEKDEQAIRKLRRIDAIGLKVMVPSTAVIAFSSAVAFPDGRTAGYALVGTILALAVMRFILFCHILPLVQPHALPALRLRKRHLRQILPQILHEFIDALPGHIVDEEDAVAPRVDQPLPDHGDIGIGGVDLRDDADEGAEDEGAEAGAEQIVGLVRSLDDGHRVRLEGKAGQPRAEMLGLCILPRRVDGVVVGAGVLCLHIVELFAPQGLGQGSLSGLAPAHQK